MQKSKVRRLRSIEPQDTIGIENKSVQVWVFERGDKRVFFDL